MVSNGTSFRTIATASTGVVAGVCGLVALSQDPFGFIFTLHTLFLGTMLLALTSGTEHLALVRSGRVESADDVSSSRRLLPHASRANYGTPFSERKRIMTRA